MKKTRLFIALLLMLVAANGYAQDSYRQTVKETLTTYMQEYLNQMESFLKNDITSWFKSGDVDLNQLTDQYVKERLMDKITDMVFPKVIELGVSEESFKETMALCATPEGKTYQEHNKQWNEAIKTEMMSVMMKDSLKISAGDTSDPIQPKAGIDAGYIEKFKSAMEGNVVNIVTKYFDQYSKLSKTILKDIPDEMKKAQEKLDNVKTWMTANILAIALNSAYGIITEDDLDFAAKLNAQDTHRLMDIVPFDDDMMSLGADMLIDYVEWMQDHGAVPEYDGMLDMLKARRAE